MGTHACADAEGRRVLFEITDEDYAALSGPFSSFEARAGWPLDPYGDDRLHGTHAAILLDLLRDHPLPAARRIARALRTITTYPIHPIGD